MSQYATPPIEPTQISFDEASGIITPTGPTLVRRISDLKGCFKDEAARQALENTDNREVYRVVSSLVPEIARELPQSITTIFSGDIAGELFMTKGHQHPDPQGEIYFGLAGEGGVIMFDGKKTKWVEVSVGKIAYIPPGWAHRSINTGKTDYKFLAVYPGSAGHDYQWVLDNGMGLRAYLENNQLALKEFNQK
jgi:glucose-6-phosphate isomerase, archaeal